MIKWPKPLAIMTENFSWPMKASPLACAIVRDFHWLSTTKTSSKLRSHEAFCVSRLSLRLTSFFVVFLLLGFFATFDCASYLRWRIWIIKILVERSDLVVECSLSTQSHYQIDSWHVLWLDLSNSSWNLQFVCTIHQCKAIYFTKVVSSYLSSLNLITLHLWHHIILAVQFDTQTILNNVLYNCTR